MSQTFMEKVFVTVGTTSFNELIEAILSKPIIDILIDKGCKNLVIQKGSSVQFYEAPTNSISCEIYSFKDSILKDINDASLVIGHCGAGTILDVLRSKKSLIVVVNDTLMDNHQIELAQELNKQSYLESCTIDNLAFKLLSFDKTKLKPFPEPNPNIFVDFINHLTQNKTY